MRGIVIAPPCSKPMAAARFAADIAVSRDNSRIAGGFSVPGLLRYVRRLSCRQRINGALLRDNVVLSASASVFYA